MSLLGKPLNYNRGSRRDARYRRLQSRVYNFLERPRGFRAIFYHVLVFFMVFTCLALSVFSTIQEYEDQAIAILFVMEIIVVIWFSIEFFLRPIDSDVHFQLTDRARPDRGHTCVLRLSSMLSRFQQKFTGWQLAWLFWVALDDYGHQDAGHDIKEPSEG
ncbi:hypothetical protein RP20_CCG023538 [Aedes albopictus]|nr:hypothetical protein RP20_CCG023538 [Aedes albopictus]